MSDKAKFENRIQAWVGGEERGAWVSWDTNKAKPLLSAACSTEPNPEICQAIRKLPLSIYRVPEKPQPTVTYKQLKRRVCRAGRLDVSFEIECLDEGQIMALS